MATAASGTVNKAPNEKLRCDIANHWVAIDQFSKKNLKTYELKARRGQATPGNSGIPCRIHSGEQVTELQCQGICHQVRSLSWFSQNTRRMGKNVCKECTEWYEQNENGMPPPLRPGEIATENAEVGALSSRMSALDILQGPEGRKLIETLLDDDDDNDDDSNDRNEVHTSYGESSASVLMSESASFITDDLQKSGISFNAYGPNGERHQLVSVHAARSSNKDVVEEKTKGKEPVKVGKSGWAKPSQRKFEPKKPGYMVYSAQSTKAIEGKDDDGYLSDDHC